MNGLPQSRSLRTRLFLAHLLVVAAGGVTLLVVTFAIGPTLHDRLMLVLLSHDTGGALAGDMTAMAAATDAVFRAAMWQALAISAGAAALVAVAVSLFLTTRIVTPLQRLLAASARIAVGHYAERVPTQGRDELAALAAQFNTMAAALEDAERRRVVLIGDVTHELRTPLATIEGYSEGVLDGVVVPDEATWALIHDEVGRLRRLVHDLQELSRAEAKQLPIYPGPVVPAELVGRAVARLSSQFADKGVLLLQEIAPNLPLVLADRDRITQVLINLLGNALRHTPSGGSVTVTTQRAASYVLFRVADTGSGVAPEHLPHLFERFYRVDKSRARTLGGSGIGLTISKAMIEVHGGQISAESLGSGLGAAFSFTLPVA